MLPIDSFSLASLQFSNHPKDPRSIPPTITAEQLAASFQRSCTIFTRPKAEPKEFKEEKPAAPKVSPYAQYMNIDLEGNSRLVSSIFSTLFEQAGSLDFSKLPTALRNNIQNVATTIKALSLKQIPLSSADLKQLSERFSLTKLYFNAKKLAEKDLHLFSKFSSLETLKLYNATCIDTSSVWDLFKATKTLKSVRINGSFLAVKFGGHRFPTAEAAETAEKLFKENSALARLKIDDFGYGRASNGISSD